VLIFFISALRSIIELLGLCLLGQATLYLLAGKERRQQNAIYKFFALLTRGPQQLVSWIFLGKLSAALSGAICFLILFIFWIALAWLRKSL
jgi:hypothetical protein